MPPPGQWLTRRTSGKGGNCVLIQSEFVMWINETKGLCSARTLAYCSSWQLGNPPPSASHSLPPSASQPANPASCLLCESVGGCQAVHVTDPACPGFPRTMPEWQHCCRWRWERRHHHTLLLLHGVSFWSMVVTSLWTPGRAEGQLSC